MHVFHSIPWCKHLSISCSEFFHCIERMKQYLYTTTRKWHDILNLCSVVEVLLCQSKALCVCVVWQLIRTGVWGAKLRIVRRGKRKRSQTHISPHENRVSDRKLSQSPCIRKHFTAEKKTTWWQRLTTWALWGNSSGNILQSLIGEYWASLHSLN